MAFGTKSIDTNLLVLDPSLDGCEAFTFSHNLYAYYRKYIWNEEDSGETEAITEKEKEKETESPQEWSGLQVRHHLFQKYHSAIENGFKLACEAGMGGYLCLKLRSFVWRNDVGQSIHSRRPLFPS